MSPFVGLGRLLALLSPQKREYRLYLFFPFYHTGGAEKIHAQIASACGGPDTIVFFTRRSKDDTFLRSFQQSGCEICDISKYTDNKLLYWANFIYRGWVSGWINRQQQPPVVFNGHSNFAYKLSPWVKKDVEQIDLVHSFNSFSLIRIPFLCFYRQTVLISKIKMDEHCRQYRKRSVPQHYLDRFVYIANAASFPLRRAEDKPFNHFQVLYIGRFSPEKRFPLFAEIAKRVHARNTRIIFKAIGVEAAQMPDASEVIVFEGTVSDPDTIQAHCFQSHVLLISSSTEGLPVAMIEALANGCAIAATPVGDIPLHIGQQQGLIFSSTEEETVIREAVAYILQLADDHDRQLAIARQNIAYANDHFSITNFNRAYRQLLRPEKC